jgi:hypothetical protein
MPDFKSPGSWQRGLHSCRGWGDCRREGDYEFPGYGPAMWWDIPAARSYATEEEELSDLRCRAQLLTRELAMVQKRITMLEWHTDRNLDG